MVGVARHYSFPSCSVFFFLVNWLALFLSFFFFCATSYYFHFHFIYCFIFLTTIRHRLWDYNCRLGEELSRSFQEKTKSETVICARGGFVVRSRRSRKWKSGLWVLIDLSRRNERQSRSVGIDSTKTQWRGIQLLVGRVVCARSIISEKTKI